MGSTALSGRPSAAGASSAAEPGSAFGALLALAGQRQGAAAPPDPPDMAPDAAGKGASASDSETPAAPSVEASEASSTSLPPAAAGLPSVPRPWQAGPGRSSGAPAAKAGLHRLASQSRKGKERPAAPAHAALDSLTPGSEPAAPGGVPVPKLRSALAGAQTGETVSPSAFPWFETPPAAGNHTAALDGRPGASAAASLEAPFPTHPDAIASAPESGPMGGGLLSTAATPDLGASHFVAAGELAFTGRLRVAPSPDESAASAPLAEFAPEGAAAAFEQPAFQGYPGGPGSRRAASPPGADSGVAQGKTTSANAPGPAAAAYAGEDGGPNGQAPSGGAPDSAGEPARGKEDGAASAAIGATRSPSPEARDARGDEAIWNDRSREPAAAFRAADGVLGGDPVWKREAGGAARGLAAERSAQASPAAPEPETAPQIPARDITLRLAGGEQRVDVRLVERQGEVHVAVRTPDAGLANDLRRDLPSLAARLEQSGFRAETWQAGSEHRRPNGGGSPAADGDSSAGQGRRNGREGRDDPSPRSLEDEGQIDRKGERKEFEWLLSSHG